MPDQPGTSHQEEGEQEPAPGALDVRFDITQSIEDMLEGLAKDFMLYKLNSASILEIGRAERLTARSTTASCSSFSAYRQKEFCTEVAIISRVRHVNLVCMKGFCVEGAERLLVYEYMPRSSLDRWIFHEETQVSPPYSSSGSAILNWDIRYRIAIETARGLAYLHEECKEAILHLDVKPQNVLLDERFRAKVSDFGLSRSMDRAQSRLLTTVRGTPGYLAPEWFSGGGIDVKTDVYGYGMLVLELVSGRRSVDQAQEDIEDWSLPAMAFRKFKESKAVDMVDPLLQGKMNEPIVQERALTILQVALWCIQEDASKRPSMSSVVQMLDGHIKVTEPPVSHNFFAAKHLGSEPLTSITIIDDDSIILPR
ncbi:hypothetical protein L7F22_063347 [Adiantum nelumboides]|nr:hypothetical protein [Adiantum nelumboides]